MKPFALYRPSTVAEGLKLRSELGPDGTWYAGGTELILAMRMGLLQPDHLVDVKRIEGLGDIVAAKDYVEIGANVTHHRIANDVKIRQMLPAFAELANSIGNIRVRCAGTLCGNLAFADPRSDPATFLLAVDARVAIVSEHAQRDCTVGDLIVGPYETSLSDDELITGVRVPKRSIAEYVRVHTAERPTLGIALTADIVDGVLSRPILAVGAATDRPMVAVGASEVLSNVDLSSLGSKGQVAGEAAAEEVVTFSDMTGSAGYKSHLVYVLVRRLLEGLSQRATSLG